MFNRSSSDSVAFDQHLQRLIGLCPYESVLIQDDSRDSCDPSFTRKSPVYIHGIFECSRLQDPCCFIPGKPDRCCQRHQLRYGRNIDAVGKISLENCCVDAIPLAFRFAPQTQFLRQAGTVNSVAPLERQTHVFRSFAQPTSRFLEITATPGKKLFNGNAFFRRFRMEGKSTPPDSDFVIFVNFFNTPGNEVAPGSTVIGKNFKCLLHSRSFLLQQYPGLDCSSILPVFRTGNIFSEPESDKSSKWMQLFSAHDRLKIVLLDIKKDTLTSSLCFPIWRWEMYAVGPRIEREHLFQEILNILHRWPERDRRVFWQAHYEGRSLEAISRSLELGVKEVSAVLLKCDYQLHASLGSFRKSSRGNSSCAA
jgi:hypothetical protein